RDAGGARAVRACRKPAARGVITAARTSPVARRARGDPRRLNGGLAPPRRRDGPAFDARLTCAALAPSQLVSRKPWFVTGAQCTSRPSAASTIVGAGSSGARLAEPAPSVTLAD